MNIEDIKLEIKSLQLKDTEDALNNGFNNKDDWFRFIINQKEDYIANAINDIAQRYNVDANVIANYFDPTMIIRLNKIKNINKKMTI